MNICICQLIKDEQRYLEEWIDYHINLGISKFILFEDYNSTSHKDVLKKYGNKVILYQYLNIVNDDDKKYYKECRQEVIWAAFCRLYKNQFDACLFIDPDEYLNCTKEEFLNEAEYFKDNPNVYTIKYCWLTHTASGHIRDPYPNQKYSIVNTYKNILPWYTDRHYLDLYHGYDFNCQYKHLVFYNKLKHIDDFEAPHGGVYPEKEELSNFRLNHYITKSWDEWKFRLFVRGEPIYEWARPANQFFVINEDLMPYKEQLLKECQNLEYKNNGKFY